MAETFQSKDDDDIHHTKWRKISRNLITELNERIIKRRQTLSQYEFPEELSQLTSDDESTSASKGLSDEYHRKKMMDAELKLKMLEAIDTVSESSSLSSSLCFQELEVHEETDERTSVTENINSHNSGADGRSDTESVSYSTSFTGSIEEDCTSNGDSNSSYLNATDSPKLQVTTDSGVDALLPSDNLGTTEEDIKSHKEIIEAQGPDFCLEVVNEELETKLSCFQAVEDDFMEPDKSSGAERDEDKQMCSKLRVTTKRKRDSVFTDDKDVTPKQAYDNNREHAPTTDFLKFIHEIDDIDNIYKEEAFQLFDDEKDTTPIESIEDCENIPVSLELNTISHMENILNERNTDLEAVNNGKLNEPRQFDKDVIKDIDYSSIGECELDNTLKNGKQLDGFDDIHQLFIDQVGEITSHQFMSSDEIIPDKMTKPTGRLLPDYHDKYRPTLIHRNYQDVYPSDLGVKSSPPKETKPDQSPFQNISCNKGTSSKECVTKDNPIPNISATSARRQTLLKDTLNRPLQFCIEKARLVTSIKEGIDNARTMKDRVAGKAAYEKAVREFTEAVDKLLVEQGSEAKDDEHSFNDNTYSLDDAKVMRKATPNPLDALRTPINKRRVAAQKEVIKKRNNDAVLGNNDTVVLEQHPSYGFEQNQKVPSLNRASTFLVLPTKKCINKEVMQTTVFGKDDNTVTLNTWTENIESNTKTIQNVTFSEDEPKIKPETREFKNDNHDELTNILQSQKDNDDTAYVSDLSPPMDNDKTYINFDHTEKIVHTDTDKYGETYTGKKNDKTFEIIKDDKTFAMDVDVKMAGAENIDNIEDYRCHSSDDETLNIIDSFCNVDNESVDLNDMLPLDDDINSNSSSQISLEDPWYDSIAPKKDENAPTFISNRNIGDRNEESAFDVDEEQFGELAVEEQRNEQPPKLQHDIIDSNVLNLNPSENDSTSVMNHNQFENYDNVYIGQVNSVNTIETSSKINNSIKTEGVTFDTDAYPSISNDQKKQAEIPQPRYDDQIQNAHQNKLRQNASGLTQMKLEVSQNESLFSISSSTSGEYSLLNPGVQKRTIDYVNQSPEIFPDQTKTELFREKEETFYLCKDNLEDASLFNLLHPPSELLIREKAADNAEGISVETPQIFHELNDIPSAYVMKQDDCCSVEKKSTPDKHQNVALETSQAKFEDSINDLRKTAIGCLGPLREKVAFFENIERALQSHETALQFEGDNDLLKHEIPDQLLELENSGSNTKTEEIVSPKVSAKSQGTITNTTKDSAVQTHEVSPPENREPQMTDIVKALENGPQFILFQNALANLIGLVDDLNVKVSETSGVFERLQNSFEDTIQITSLERERMNCSMEALTRRIDSNEQIILEKISSVETLILSASDNTGSGFQMVKEELEKLRMDNAEHFVDLKRFSSEMAIHKEDLDLWENKVTTEFKEHMNRVQSALENLQESKPDPSSSSRDPDTSKQSCIDDLRIRVIEMKNQRDAEKMYHKITRESMRALERDHDRLRQEVLLASTRRHLTDRRKSLRLHSLAEESSIADIEIPPLTSTPRKNPDIQKKEIHKSTTTTNQSVSDAKKDKKSKK